MAVSTGQLLPPMSANGVSNHHPAGGKLLDEVRISAIAYEAALEHVCPSGRPPTTRYEEATVATLRRVIKGAIEKALRQAEARADPITHYNVEYWMPFPAPPAKAVKAAA